MRGGLGCPDDLRRDDLAVTTFAVTTLAVTTFAVSKLAVTTFAVTTLAVTTFAVASRPHYLIFGLPVACRPLYRVYVNQQFHQTVLLDLLPAPGLGSSAASPHLLCRRSFSLCPSPSRTPSSVTLSIACRLVHR